jgi:hypothetical protein
MSEERLSFKAIDDYSDDFSSKVVAAYFSNRERITGPEILQVTALEQVNYFVLRELLVAWRHEGQKWRSPFFNYQAAPVAEAVRNLSNVLSKHISISPENFQPLLKKAVSAALFLIVDPYDFFSDVLDRSGSGTVKVEELKSDIKYIKINRPPLERLVQQLEQRQVASLTGKEAFALLDQLLEELNFQPEDVDAHLARFSTVVPIRVQQLFEKPAEAKADVRPPETRQAPPKPAAPPAVAKPVAASNAPKSATVGSNFQKITRIQDGLTINQKFMFTKILFNGDFEIFTNAIEKLDKMPSLEKATEYLTSQYPEWDRESEEFEEFMELVTKRFT